MNTPSDILGELIAALREFLTHLKLVEKSILSGDINLASTYELENNSHRKKIIQLKARAKKCLETSPEEDIEITSLMEQKMSLEKKIKEMVKTNKSLSTSGSFAFYAPEEDVLPKKQVMTKEEESSASREEEDV